jgi:hypothetical protein
LAMSKQTYPFQENPRSIAACLLKTTMPLSQGAQTRGECDCWCGAGWKSWKACHVPARQGPAGKKEFGGLFSIVSGIDILASFRNAETYLVPVGSISRKGCPTIQVSHK